MVATRPDLTECDRADLAEPPVIGDVDFNGTPVLSDDEPTDDEWFSEEELARLALAADPDTPVGADAVPWSLHLGQMSTMLPQWYMPPAVSVRRTRWRTALVLAIVLALVMIDAWGLCSTYGAVVTA